ncbi:MAG: NAD+ synthase [Phycisphaeraceae bacterium]|nr:NAD+ synthase [Phycisphaeraceae bacterium]MCB9846945.1 NAD+ synthase [Phycisphaeraceae bacterium]
MRIALAPLNPTVGDLDGNTSLIERAIDDARAQGADLLLTPELSVVGYPPRDLVLYESFIDAAMNRIRRLAQRCDGMTVIVGAPRRIEGRPVASGVANCLFALRDGGIVAHYDKRLLPTYDVFDEARYFVPGESPVCIDVAGVRVGLLVCEDIWRGGDAGVPQRYKESACPVAGTVAAGARLLVIPSASPFVLAKAHQQDAILERHVREQSVPLVSINQSGGQDDLIFDGRCSAIVPDPRSPGGVRTIARSEAFEDRLLIFESPDDPARWADHPAVPPVQAPPPEELLFRALVVGVRDYLRKTGFGRVVIGLSGGIDSAVTACIAASAIGAEHVLCLAMPGRHSSEGSVTDADRLAQAAGITMLTAPIDPMHTQSEQLLRPLFREIGADESPGVTDENVQARLRGLILMAFANKLNALLLTTGNKSELAVGYCTLYGDMNGGLAVLSDLTKAQVYGVARWINENPGRTGLPRDVIPRDTITKPPSAELRPDQTDQDSLPPYDTVDEVVGRYVGARQDIGTIVAQTTIPEETVRMLVALIDRNEYKRRQAALGLKVSAVAFGPGRRMPMAQRWRHAP